MTTSPPTLHAILAVEPTREAAAKKQSSERIATFEGKRQLYLGKSRVLRMFGKDESNSVEFTALENKDSIDDRVQATIPDDLNYMAGVVGQWLDVNLTKERTNQVASADLVIDGVTLVKAAPAIWLLGMETKLTNLRKVYEAIPTLAPGQVWNLAAELGPNIYATPTVSDVKVNKVEENVCLKSTNDKFPDTWTKAVVTKNIGEYQQSDRSGMISVAAKAAVLARVDKLLMALKVARQEANSKEVQDPNEASVSEILFGFLHGDMHNLQTLRTARG